MSYPVPVDLEEFDTREVWILESRIEQQGETEVSPLLVQPLLSRIPSSACLHGFQRSVDITQEKSSGGGRGGRSATKRKDLGMWQKIGQERRC